MRNFLFAFLVALAFAGFSPSAYALSHTYTCSELSHNGGGGSCSSDAWTFDGSGAAYFYSSGAEFPFVSGNTYYYTATVSGLGSASFCNIQSGTNGNVHTLSSTIYNQSFLATGVGSAFGIALSDTGQGICTSDTASPTGQSVTISALCVSDTLNECPNPTPPAGGGSGSILQWLLWFMAFCFMFVFLIAISPRFQEFMSSLSPALWLSGRWGRRKLKKKLWK